MYNIKKLKTNPKIKLHVKILWSYEASKMNIRSTCTDIERWHIFLSEKASFKSYYDPFVIAPIVCIYVHI